MVKNCYIHIPFCNKICSYCDFCKLFYNKKFVNKYLTELEKEIKNNYKNEKMETIYIGGGTPSCLSIEELERLFQILSFIKKANNIEYTIEANVESLDKEKLLLMHKYGINRISIGIETIDSNNLNILDRVSDKDKIISTIKMIRDIGFNNINLDLMYAIPGEDISTLEKDIDFILNLDPEHISTYSLIIENNTKLSINNTKYIDDELDFKMYSLICDKLKNSGYKHYEISNFAKEGYYSKHNMCYWNNDEYYGFGLGASSYLNNYRYSNTRSINNYKNNIMLDKEFVDLDSKIEYEILLGLRLIAGIDLDLFKKQYKKELIELYDYNLLVSQGLLCLKNNHLFIPEDKLYVSNEIIVKLIQNKK